MEKSKELRQSNWSRAEYFSPKRDTPGINVDLRAPHKLKKAKQVNRLCEKCNRFLKLKEYRAHLPCKGRA